MIPLHNHSEMSAFDGFSTVEEIAARIEDLGLSGAYVTDHGVTAAWRSFSKAMDKRDLFAGYGVEAYQTRLDSRKLKPKKGDDPANPKSNRDQNHLILLAQSQKGIRNIYRMTDEASRTGFHYVPRLDWELLEAYSEDVICTSACIQGLLSQRLAAGDESIVDRYLRIFGDRFYIELHTYDTDDQREMNKVLVALANERGIALVYANDAHYDKPSNYPYHEVLFTMQQAKKTLNSEDRMSHPPCLYIMGEDDVRDRLNHLPADIVDEAIANTDLIAHLCRDARLPGYQSHLPVFVSRDAIHETNSSRFIRLVEEGCVKKYGDFGEEVEDRASTEMSTILNAGLVDYFLITHDLCSAADDAGIERGPGRGSVGGSLVANALNITDIDPLKYGLFFERFYNAGREKGLPDIDLDFETRGRRWAIDYAKERYGEYNVIPIANHIRMKPLAAIQRLTKVFDVPWADFQAMKKIVESTPDIKIVTADQVDWFGGPDTKVAVLEDYDPKTKEWVRSKRADSLQEYMDKYPDLFESIFVLGGRLLGYGTHASAVVISDVDTRDYLPAMLASREGDDKELKEDKLPTTQIDMREVEELGFPKFDFLGLRNLDTLALLTRMTGDRSYRTTDYDKMPEQFWHLMDKGLTIGLFQIEEGMGRGIGRRMHPRSIPDLAAITALNRPGPLRSGVVDRFLGRRAGDLGSEFAHEILEPILRETYGDFLYQEQVIQYVGKIGYDLKEADWIRKMLGKKLATEMAKELPRYIERAKQYMDESTAQAIWDSIVEFSLYSFNKSHSVGYGTILAWTMWAKFFYPAEYIMCLIQTDPDRKGPYISEGRKMGINVLPPDINLSGYEISKVGNDIYFGLSNIKGVKSAAKWIIEHRPFKSLEHFDETLEEAQQEWIDNGKRGPSPRMTVKRNIIEALYNAGAFDTIEDRDVSDHERAKYEEELLGFVVTDTTRHIIEDNEDKLENLDSLKNVENPEYLGEALRVPGVVVATRKHTTRKNTDMMFVSIRWEDDEVDFSVFAEQLQRFEFMLKPQTVGIWKLKPTPKGINMESAQKLVAHG